MSGELKDSREAQLTPEEDKKLLNSFLRLSKDEFEIFIDEDKNLLEINKALKDTRISFFDKCKRNGLEVPDVPENEEVEAPAIIKEQSKSDQPPPPESQDVEYLSIEEVRLGEEKNTLDTLLFPDPDAGPNHPGPFIDRVIGRNQETGRQQVVKIPAKQVPVLPSQVVRYRGAVVLDHNATHSTFALLNRTRHLYVFDRFFYFNKQKLARCCYVPDRIHQAGIIYEKYVLQRIRKAVPRMKRIKGSNEPMYEVIGAKETDYRDLKRLFERYYLNRHDHLGDEDPALAQLFGKIPLVTQDEFLGG